MTCVMQMTEEEHERGYALCGCGKYAHVFRASVLQQLPKDYHGECCPECQCWMVAVEKLTPNVEFSRRQRFDGFGPE